MHQKWFTVTDSGLWVTSARSVSLGVTKERRGRFSVPIMIQRFKGSIGYVSWEILTPSLLDKKRKEQNWESFTEDFFTWPLFVVCNSSPSVVYIYQRNHVLKSFVLATKLAKWLRSPHLRTFFLVLECRLSTTVSIKPSLLSIVNVPVEQNLFFVFWKLSINSCYFFSASAVKFYISSL